jgi:uncharacterized protein involved in exopolysaccharide biosynthesis/Mrp family chromosome partitioning ATPase
MSDQFDELEEQDQGAQGGGSVSLPVHPLTLLLGLWSRRKIVIYCMIPLFVVSVIVAKAIRTRIYGAQVLLLFDPPTEEEEGDSPSQLSIYTLIDLIKTHDTLDLARTKINLPARVKTVGAAIDIELRNKTTLLEITTEWDDPDIAAGLANATYEAFFEQLSNMQTMKRSKELEDLQTRLKEVNAELTIRDQELKEFTLENKIVDLDKEALAYLQQLVTLDTDYDRELSRLESVRKQQESLKTIIEELKVEAVEEAQAMKAQSSSVTEANVKVQRLRELISESQTSRAKEADLTVRYEDLKRAQKLRELDAISQSEYDKVVAEYEAAKALSTDTEEIIEWKEEIKKLDASIVPDGTAPSTATVVLLQSLVSKTIDLKLEATAAEESAKSLDDARGRARKRLDIIPQVKQAYTEKLRRVEALVNDRKTLQGMIALITRQLGSSQIPFRVVSRAQPPMFHKSSNTKMIFIGLFMLGAMAVGGIVLLLEVRTLGIKSRGSLKAALPAPPLAAFQHRDDPKALLPGPAQPAEDVEACQRAVMELQRNLPAERPCVILVTGPVPEVGVTTVVLNLAARLQRKGDAVVLVDGHTRPQANRPRASRLADFIGGDSLFVKGLADYLNSETLEEEEILYPVPIMGSTAVIGSPKNTVRDLPKADRLSGLITFLKSRYSFILIDAPALNAGIETEYLAQYADVAIYVTRSGALNLFSEKSVYKKLENIGLPVVGTVLTDVQDLYKKV